MNKVLIIVATVAAAAGGVIRIAHAQELSMARYVGSVDGAAEACAAAFPNKAQAYRDALYKSFQCHTGRTAFTRWHQELRQGRNTASDYQQGFIAAQTDLSANRTQRAKQCESLEQIPCEPKAGPLLIESPSR